MDNDILIAEVYNRRPLWDQNHEDHNSRTLTDKLWDEVAAILNVPKDKARLRWRYLRGTFRNVIKKYPPPPPGCEDETPSAPWCYYNPLMFLNGQFRPKFQTDDSQVNQSGNIVRVDVVEDQSDSWCEDAEEDELFRSRPRKKDDDLQFFKSILPTIKSVSLERKFFLKMKIQELIYQEVFSNSSGSDQPTIITLVNSSRNHPQ